MVSVTERGNNHDTSKIYQEGLTKRNKEANCCCLALAQLQDHWSHFSPTDALSLAHLQSQHRQCPFHEPSVCSSTAALQVGIPLVTPGQGSRPQPITDHGDDLHEKMRW